MANQREYPFLKALKPKPNMLDLYYGEVEELGTDGLYEILDKGKEWSSEVASRLSSGGGAIFPHTFVSKCGYQIAAVVQGIIESGADQVVVLGTAHAFPGEMFDARVKELNRSDITKERVWGVLDPKSSVGHLLEIEFSLDLFNKLWELEIERRGITPPKIIERYPCLTNRSPESLPGIDELKELAENSVIVGTEDFCHHGVAYGVDPKEAVLIDKTAYRFAQDHIEKGFSLLEKGDQDGYFELGMDPHALDDPLDVAVVMHHIIGKKASPKILDLNIADVSTLFEGEPEPSWVATALITM